MHAVDRNGCASKLAQGAILADGRFTEEFRVEPEHEAVMAFGQRLRTDDEVVLEATGNTAAVVRLLTPFVARVVTANPLQVKASAHARVPAPRMRGDEPGMQSSINAAGGRSPHVRG